MLLANPSAPTHQQRGVSLMAPGVSINRRSYVDPMPVTTSQVAAVLAGRIPGADPQRLHRLLYYVQGHHLALRGRPAFDEPVIAGPDGPYIHGDIEPDPDAPLPGSHANVALMVAARYGGLTSADLDRLTRAEQPWQDTALNAEISHQRMRDFFAGPGAQQHAHLYPPHLVTRLREGVTAARAEHPTPTRTAGKAAGDGR